MNRESKVLLGVGALALLGLLVAVTTSPTLGVLVIGVGLLGGMVFLRATRPDQSDPFADARSVADETNVGNLTPAEPLAPWTPDGGLTAWTPPAGLAPPAPADDFVDSPRAEWDDAGWDQTVTWEPPASAPAPAPAPAPAETNPLDDLVGFDRMDPVAEVERIEERTAQAPSPFEPLAFDDIELDIHGNAVNEAVTGADDIMAASQATELHLGEGGEQTELQKLLAKVQIRLSAYE